MGQVSTLDVYLEIGKKKVFASATHWPGWCRSGRSESEALASLANYAQRYAGVLKLAGLPFDHQPDLADFNVTDRMIGDSGTDFGAPSIAPRCDADEVDAIELARMKTLLSAAWQTLDLNCENARGKELQKGPRGGGRNLGAMVKHVVDAQIAYLGRIGVKLALAQTEQCVVSDYFRQVIVDSLEACVRRMLPDKGPRGGVLWTPRYFVRRTMWHILDHAWELEDRIL